jgi:hypothetical protein
MRKSFTFISSLILVVLLAACEIPAFLGSAAPAGDTAAPETSTGETTAPAVFATPDQSLATPTIGAVTILAVQGDKAVFLYSLPTTRSVAAAQVKPGDVGQVLGFDSSGTWLLVEIKGKTGWAPIQLLDYTIAQ